MNNEKNIIICLECETKLNKNKDSFNCEKCGIDYPIKENIGFLIKSPEEHLKKIQDKILGLTKDWYTGEQIKSNYEGPYKYHLEKRRKFVKNILENFRNNNKEIKNILDLGCGDGANFSWLKDFSNNFYAVDYNFIRLKRAKEYSKKLEMKTKLFLSDLFDLPFEKNTFDVIFFNHVIEHVKDDVNVLKNVFKILKKNGIVILGTPNEGVFFWKLAYALEPDVKRNTDHVNFYTEKSLRKIAIEAGFSVEHIEHIGWGIPIWKLDPIFRKHKKIDDIFESIGKRIIKKQATSLYAILKKPDE